MPRQYTEFPPDFTTARKEWPFGTFAPPGCPCAPARTLVPNAATSAPLCPRAMGRRLVGFTSTCDSNNVWGGSLRKPVVQSGMSYNAGGGVEQ